jgi:hypothetical protein
LISVAGLLFLIEPYIKGHPINYFSEHSASSSTTDTDKISDKFSSLKLSFKDLEHDYATGKISDTDYEVLKKDLYLDWKAVEEQEKSNG